MGSTNLRRPCKPWPRFDWDTCRVNESPREAREHFASRLKAWVRFRPRMFFFVFCFCFKKNEEEAIKPSTRMILVHVQKMYKTYIYIGVPDYSSSSFFAFFKKNEEEAIPLGGKKKLGTCTEDVQYI